MFKFLSLVFAFVLCINLQAQNEIKLSSKGTGVKHKKESVILDSLSISSNLSSKARNRELPTIPSSNRDDNSSDGVLSKRKQK